MNSNANTISQEFYRMAEQEEEEENGYSTSNKFNT